MNAEIFTLGCYQTYIHIWVKVEKLRNVSVELNLHEILNENMGEFNRTAQDKVMVIWKQSEKALLGAATEACDSKE